MGVKINSTTGEPVYDSEHESEYDSQHESESSGDECEDEDTTDNMILRENNLPYKRDGLLDKDRQKKLKSKNQDVGTFSRDNDGEEEGRDSTRTSILNDHMDPTKNTGTTEKKRGRGKNKCKKLAKLKPDEKIKVMFYNNRALCTSFARHIGRIVRDPTITPVMVKKWTDITESSLKHIFAAVKDKFENIHGHIEIDVYKNDIMEHARDLWNNWRGDMNRHYVKPARNMQQAIKNCPKDFPQADWEWLVKEHFYSKEFIGGKDNKPPSLDALFFMTHTKGGNFMDSDSSSKHAQLEEQISSDPSLSNAQLMDKCFPSKRSDHVIGYSGGVKARDLRNAAITKAELIERLKQSEDEKQAMQEKNRELREENQVTRNRVSRMEQEWEQLKNKLSGN